jgi:hypothetical protein
MEQESDGNIHLMMLCELGVKSMTIKGFTRSDAKGFAQSFAKKLREYLNQSRMFSRRQCIFFAFPLRVLRELCVKIVA